MLKPKYLAAGPVLFDIVSLVPQFQKMGKAWGGNNLNCGIRGAAFLSTGDCVAVVSHLPVGQSCSRVNNHPDLLSLPYT